MNTPQPLTADSGAPIEEQVHKEGNPRRGGLPMFRQPPTFTE